LSTGRVNVGFARLFLSNDGLRQNDVEAEQRRELRLGGFLVARALSEPVSL